MSDQYIILLNAVLVGLTSLIPFPFIDDWATAIFHRRLVEAVIKKNYPANPLNSDEISILAEYQDIGCIGTFFNRMLIYPLTKIFRKIFFFLEWRRAINMVVHSYYHGILLDYVVANHSFMPGEGVEKAIKIRSAIRKARKNANKTLLFNTVKRAFNSSKEILLDASQMLYQLIKKVAYERVVFRLNRSANSTWIGKVPFLGTWLKNLPSPDLPPDAETEIEQTLEENQSPEKSAIKEFITNLQSEISRLPQGQYDDLIDRLLQELRVAA